MVQAYCATGHYCAEEKRMHAFRVLSHCQSVDAAAFEPLLKLCVKCGDDTALRKAVGLMRQRDASPTAQTYGSLISARIERGEAVRALRVCESALASGIAPPQPSVSALMVALSAAGLSGNALEVLTELRVRHAMRLARNDTGLIALLDGAAAALDAPLVVLSVYNEAWHHSGLGDADTRGRIKRDGVRRHGSVLDDLLMRCLAADNLPAARVLIEQLETDGVTLAPATLDAAVQALLQAGDVAEAMRVSGSNLASSARSTADAASSVQARPGKVEGGVTGLVRSVVAAASSPSKHLDSSAPRLQLDLSASAEGDAQLQLVRLFQRLAMGETSTSSPTACPASVTIIARQEHASTLVHAAATLMEPPLSLAVEEIGTAPDDRTESHGRKHQTIRLLAEETTLHEWWGEVREQRRRRVRASQFALAAVSHNALWTFALLGWVGA